MIVEPENYLDELKKMSYMELLTLRNEVLSDIKEFQRDYDMKSGWEYMPSPNVFYQMNLKKLAEIIPLMEEAFRNEYVSGEKNIHDYYREIRGVGKKGVTMSTIKLIKGSCADQNVDAVVNAANSGLWEGGGICGVIFKKCDSKELSQACSAIPTPVKDGNAVITPAFNMKNAKHIIHAVGPDFRSSPKAFLELFNAYYNSLVVLKNNNLHSISFPLISSGIFAGNLPNPAGESAKQFGRAYKKFEQDYPDYNVNVVLCAYKDSEYKAAGRELKVIVPELNKN